MNWSSRNIRLLIPALTFSALLVGRPADGQAQPAAALSLEPGDRVVFIGNTFAERMSLFPHLEAELVARSPDTGLSFRNLGWSGDEITLMPRPLNFGDLDTHLSEQRADVIFAFFGMNESFAGADGLPAFRTELHDFLSEMRERRYNGERPPRLVLVSPIAHERVARVPLDPTERNRDIALYTAAMSEVASRLGVTFVDLFTPTLELARDRAVGELTINGIHPNDRGYWVMSRMLLAGLGMLTPEELDAELARLERCADVPRSVGKARLEAAILEKNELFFYRWRPVNGEYIYGRRKEPFGVVNFPPEMRKLEEMIAAREREISALALALASDHDAGLSAGCSSHRDPS